MLICEQSPTDNSHDLRRAAAPHFDSRPHVIVEEETVINIPDIPKKKNKIL
jgi:hypothetical protein